MKQLSEILPILLFFLAFKYYGMYAATVVGIVATFAQTILIRVFSGKWDRMQLITLAVFLVFGGMTLYFHDPIFVKWKPTIIYWIFALVILGSQYFTQKPVIQRLMEKALQDKTAIPAHVFRQLNLVWGLFFMALGGVNIYVAYQFSSNAWVNFKFYGVTSALIIFTILQSIYLAKYLSEEKIKHD